MARSFLRLILATLTGLALVVTAEARPDHPPAYPDRIDLLDGFLPEGIAIGPGPIAYFGSRADGDIDAADLRTGQGAVFSHGPAPRPSG
jgi:hypothetical protein